MDIRVLRYFLAIAREGNITVAANYLNLTQPTLSRQIQDLEKELGQKLFVRGSHSVTLTSEGILLRKRAEEIIEMVEKTEAEFSSIKETIGGDIYIGGGETDAIRLIAKVMKDLRKDYPAIRYHLYSGNSEDVTERLDKGLLDFGILIEPADIAKYNYINIPAKDVWGIIMRKDSILSKKKKIERKDLLNLPLMFSIQAIRSTASKNEFMEWFGKDLDRLNIVSTFNLVYNASIMVEEGIGYAVTLDKIINTSKTGNLCFKPLYPRLESGLNLVWKKNQVFSKASEIFLQKIKDSFSN